MLRVLQESSPKSLRQRLVIISALVVVMFGFSGCAGPNGGLGNDGQHSPKDTDIFKVVCSYPTKMWRSFDANGDPSPGGFVFVMYLLSKKTGRGAYANGTFRAKIYRVDRTSGQVERTLVIELAADMADVPKRTETVVGYSYQPQLDWGDIDIYGQEIDIVVQYESPIGRVVRSQTHTTKVPQRKM